MRNFKEDLEKSNDCILRQSWENIFRIRHGLNIIITWKDNETAQIDFESDVILETNRGRRYSINVKTRNNDYLNNKNYIFEIIHHRYSDNEMTKLISSKPGWLYCSPCEYVYFGTIDKNEKEVIEVCAFTLSPFKDEYMKTEITQLKLGKNVHTDFRNGYYQCTLNKIVPKEFIEKYAHNYWYWKK